MHPKYLLLISFLYFGAEFFAQNDRIVQLDAQFRSLMQSRDYERAIETALEIKKEFKARNITDTLSHLLFDANLAALYNSTLQYKQTIGIYERYHKCVSCENDPLAGLYVSLLGSAASAYSNESDFSSALKINNKEIEIIQKSNDPSVQSGLGSCIIEQAGILVQLNRLKEAERLYDLVIQVETEGQNKDVAPLIRALSGKADVHHRQNDFSGSIDYTFQALELYEQNKDSLLKIPHHQLGYCKNLLDLSQHFTDVADFENALVFGERTVEMAEKLNISPYYKALAYTSLGQCYMDVGDLPSAELVFEHALEIEEIMYGKDSPYLILPLSNYATFISGINFEKAIRVASRGIKISQGTKEYYQGTEALYSTISGIYADIMFKGRNLDSALYYAKECQKIAKRNHGEASEQYITSFDKIAFCYSLFDQQEKALPYQKEYLEKIIKVYGKEHDYYRNGLFSIAITYKAVGDLTKAELCRIEVMEWWNDYIRRNYLSLVGTIHKNQRIIDGFENHMYFVMDNFSQLKDTRSLTVAYENQLLLKNLQLRTSGSLRKEAEANPVIMEKLNTYFELQAQATTAETKLELTRLEKELYSSSKAFKSLEEDKGVTTQDISAKLKTGEVAVEFVRYYEPEMGDHSYVAMVIRPNNPVPYIAWLCTEDSLESALTSMDLSKLYQFVWKHVPEVLPTDTRTVYLSPVSLLNNVPFHALCIAENNETNSAASSESVRGAEVENTTAARECTYLMDQYALHLVASTRTLLEDNDPLLERGLAILSVGGVDYDKAGTVTKRNTQAADQEFYQTLYSARGRRGSSFNYLEGTEEEVVMISKLAKNAGWKEVGFGGVEASENKVKTVLNNEKFGILHLATHGFSFPEQIAVGETSYASHEDPMSRCGLVLAGGNQSWSNPDKLKEMLNTYGEDGILTGKEVIELPMGSTRLVVLSACKTGIGKIEGTEGSFSVNRAFLVAGVDYVISSLWSVPDKETMELMTLFYEELTRTLNIESSFQFARLEMRKRYPDNPTAWAGFVLVR